MLPEFEEPLRGGAREALHLDAEDRVQRLQDATQRLSTLYEEVCISTEPSTVSEGMFSWFPLYVPLRHPVPVADGATIEAHFWRHASHHKVWYEWALTQPTPSPIHNPNGRSYFIGL
mgnify:CR=1 FL=1